MVTTKSVPEGVQAVFPMLVCQNPEAEMDFCAVAFGAVEQVRRPGPDGSPIHIAMRINGRSAIVEDIVTVSSVRAPTAPARFRPRFFLSAGALLLVITVTGFAPTFFLAPLFGAPPLPPYLVIHGLFAAGWVLAFVAQAALIRTSNVALHMRTGRLAALLGAGMVLSGLYVLHSMIKSADLPAELSRVSPGVWGNLAILIAFSVFVALGYRFRRRPQIHKRLMFLATISIMGQPLVRIGWLAPFRLSENRMINDAVYGLGGLAVLLIATLVYEARTRGRPHMVTAVGGVLVLAAIIVGGFPVASSRVGTALILWVAGL